MMVFVRRQTVFVNRIVEQQVGPHIQWHSPEMESCECNSHAGEMELTASTRNTSRAIILMVLAFRIIIVISITIVSYYSNLVK